jgi:hypothetical protein
VSITGYWIMGAVSPGAFKSLREDIDATQFEPVSDDADLEWWAAMDHAALPAPGHRYQPGEAAMRFVEELASLRPPEETIERCIGAFHHTVGDIHFMEGARKGDPFAALCYGLTFGAARRLPGRAGCFLLDEAEAVTALASVGAVLEQPPGGRPAYADRVETWIDIMTDAPGLEPLRLLDGPLRVLRRAAETGSAVVAVTHWY